MSQRQGNDYHVRTWKDNVNSKLTKTEDEVVHFSVSSDVEKNTIRQADIPSHNDARSICEYLPTPGTPRQCGDVMPLLEKEFQNPSIEDRKSRKAIIIDSPPLDYELAMLESFLKSRMGFDEVSVKVYPNKQGTNQCGYIAIFSVFGHLKTDRLINLSQGSLFKKPDSVINFFNTIIDYRQGNCAIQLTDVHILRIVRHITFLDINFHLESGSFTEATTLSQYRREIFNMLNDAVPEANDPWGKFSLKVTMDTVSKMLQFCLCKAKEGNFKMLLNQIQNLLTSGEAVDHAKIATVFEDDRWSLSTENWFAGVFSCSEFRQFIQNEVSSTDTELIVRKCAILNTSERTGHPEQSSHPRHWVAIAYEIKHDKIKYQQFKKATHG